MPVEAKPLFRPDVLRAHLAAFSLPAHVDAFRPKLVHWADLLSSGKANAFKEQELLPDFLTDYFCELLGYTRPADGGPRYTISREKHVEVDGKYADAVLGDFGSGPEQVHRRLGGQGTERPAGPAVCGPSHVGRRSRLSLRDQPPLRLGDRHFHPADAALLQGSRPAHLRTLRHRTACRE